jgi:hypothetical protein
MVDALSHRNSCQGLAKDGLACLTRVLTTSATQRLTSFHVNPVHGAILLKQVQDGPLRSIILKVAAEDLQAAQYSLSWHLKPSRQLHVVGISCSAETA